jgi:hypothetical protein
VKDAEYGVTSFLVAADAASLSWPPKLRSFDRGLLSASTLPAFHQDPIDRRLIGEMKSWANAIWH